MERVVDVLSKSQCFANYDEAIRRNPKDAAAFFSRGVFYVGKDGDNAKAFYNFDQAIRLRQDIAWPYSRRGECYEIMGELDAGIAAHIIDELAGDGGVWSGEIYKFKEIELRGGRDHLLLAHAVFIKPDHFARLDLSEECGAHRFECA